MAICTGIGNSVFELELELELELILQTPLFPFPQGLSAPNLAGLGLRMRGPHQQSHVTLQYHGRLINKQRCISTFTRPMDLKRSRVVTRTRGPHLQNHVAHRPRGRMTNKNHYISIFTRTMGPKLSRVVI